MKTLSIIVIFSIFAFFSCNKAKINEKEPECIKNKIEIFAKNTCEVASVKKYIFQNKTVYLFDQSSCCCDFQSEVTDSACNTLGYLGGIAGITEINGESFSNAKLVETIWETNK
jgi:hypothetical protein